MKTIHSKFQVLLVLVGLALGSCAEARAEMILLRITFSKQIEDDGVVGEMAIEANVYDSGRCIASALDAVASVTGYGYYSRHEIRSFRISKETTTSISEFRVSKASLFGEVIDGVVLMELGPIENFPNPDSSDGGNEVMDVLYEIAMLSSDVVERGLGELVEEAGFFIEGPRVQCMSVSFGSLMRSSNLYHGKRIELNGRMEWSELLGKYLLRDIHISGSEKSEEGESIVLIDDSVAMFGGTTSTNNSVQGTFFSGLKRSEGYTAGSLKWIGTSGLTGKSK